MKIIWALLILFILVPVSHAKSLYVTDVLYITLRAGPDDSFKVLKALKSGTKLEFIEENADGYTRVVTSSGDEGWASTKYLVDEPIAAIKLAELEESTASLKQEYEEIKQKHAIDKEKIKELEKDRKRLESTNTNLKNDNSKLQAISARPMELAKENEQLKAANMTYESQIMSLEEENRSFKDNTQRDWFLVGGGVLFFGIIVGLILPSIRWGRNKDWA